MSKALFTKTLIGNLLAVLRSVLAAASVELSTDGVDRVLWCVLGGVCMCVGGVCVWGGVFLL